MASTISGIMQPKPLGASRFVSSRRKPRLMKPARRDELLEQGGGRVNRSAISITARPAGNRPAPAPAASAARREPNWPRHRRPTEQRQRSVSAAHADQQYRAAISQAGAVHRQQNRLPNRHRLLRRPARQEVKRTNTTDQPVRQQSTQPLLACVRGLRCLPSGSGADHAIAFGVLA